MFALKFRLFERNSLLKKYQEEIIMDIYAKLTEVLADHTGRDA